MNSVEIIKNLVSACKEARADENICRKCFDVLGDAIKQAEAYLGSAAKK